MMKPSHSNTPVLGALTLNCLSYGLLAIVNNLWSWLTVVAASFRFWNLRALSSSPPPKPEDRGATEDDSASVSPSGAEPAEDLKKHLVVPVISSSLSFCEGDSPKVKFSVYYEEAEYGFRGKGEREEMEEEECNGRTAEAVVEEVGRRWWSDCDGGDWERRMVVRMGDMGWYTCQDLRVLNGSVVRLWKTPRRRRAAEGFCLN